MGYKWDESKGKEPEKAVTKIRLPRPVRVKKSKPKKTGALGRLK